MKKLIGKYKNSAYRKEIDETLWVMGLQGLNYVVPVMVIPYLMVTLGAEKFGYYTFALAVCQWLMLIVDFGFNLSATKRIAIATTMDESARRKNVSRIFSNVLFAKMGLLSVAFLVLLGLTFVPQFVVYRKAMLLMFTMVIGNAFLFVFLFQGIGKIKWVSIVNGVARISVLPLTFLLVRGPEDYDVAVLLQGLVSVVAALISGLLVYRKKWVRFQLPQKAFVKEEMKESLPLFLSIAATSVYTSLFVVYLGLFVESDELGQYGAGDKLTRAATFLVLTPALQVFYPRVSQRAAVDMQGAHRQARFLLKLMVAYTTLWGVALFFCAEWILGLLGKDYESGSNIFRIFALMPVWIGISGVLGQCYLLAMGGSDGKKWFERSYLVAAIVATACVLIMTPWMHAEGTAISMVVTEVSVVMMMCLGLRTMKKKTE